MAGPIDRDKPRMTLRRLRDEFVFRLLYDAVELMPPAKLHKLVEPYLDPLGLLPDDNQPKNLLAKVQSFERTSFAGDYYDHSM